MKTTTVVTVAEFARGVLSEYGKEIAEKFVVAFPFPEAEISIETAYLTLKKILALSL